MVMEYKHRTSSYFTYDHENDDPQSSSENGADATTPSPNKKSTSRSSIQKRVVTVRIGDIEGSRSKGEAYPPSDSWAWRKYGQKPIKGSPYPRGYYRCSSSKGCPARKQVERSRMDPFTLIITYAYEHNHALPTTKHQHHNQHQAVASPNINVTSSSTPNAADCVEEPSSSPSPSSSPLQLPPLQINPFGDPIQLEFVGDTHMVGSYLGVEYNWISDLSFDHPTLVGPKCEDVEVVTFHMKQEDEFLFGDLDELPECSLVLRRGQQSIETCSSTTPICGST